MVPAVRHGPESGPAQVSSNGAAERIRQQSADRRKHLRAKEQVGFRAYGSSPRSIRIRHAGGRFSYRDYRVVSEMALLRQLSKQRVSASSN